MSLFCLSEIVHFSVNAGVRRNVICEVIYLSYINCSVTHHHRRTGRGAGGAAWQFVDMNSGRESTLFGQNTIHV